VETSWGYAESEEELKRAYALKGSGEEEHPHQVPWEQARKEQRRIMVLADPGMGKSTLLCLEARRTAQAGRQKLTQGKATVADTSLPIFLRLSELQKENKEISEAIFQLLRRDYPETFPGIAHLFEEKLALGHCLLLLDALDEVPLEQRQGISEKLCRFISRFNRCLVVCTSRLVGYAGGFLDGAKEMEIVPFGTKEIEKFIHAWFANAAPSLQGKSVTADGLIKELRDKLRFTD
jgi:predicted NACHT family NTPase